MRSSNMESSREPSVALALLAVLAEAWLFLLVIPFLSGAGVYILLSYGQTTIYESSAELALFQEDAGLMLSERLLISTISSLKIKQESENLDEKAKQVAAAAVVRGKTSVQVANSLQLTEPDPFFLSTAKTTISLRYEDPIFLDALYPALISNYTRMFGEEILQTFRHEVKAAIEAENAMRLTYEATVSEMIQKMPLSTSQDTDAIALKYLGDRIDETADRILNLKLALSRIPHTVILSPPSPPRPLPNRSPSPIAIASALFAFSLSMLCVFVRAAWHQAVQNPANEKNVERIKFAFLLPWQKRKTLK